MKFQIERLVMALILTFSSVVVAQQNQTARCNETLLAVISSFGSKTSQLLAADLVYAISSSIANSTKQNFIEVFKQNVNVFKLVQSNQNDRKLLVELTRSVFNTKNDVSWSINEHCYRLERVAGYLTRFSPENQENANKFISQLYSSYPSVKPVFVSLYTNENYFKQFADTLIRTDPEQMKTLVKTLGV
jgi:hypothetical protein